jgi:hypothetical protein
MVGKRNRQRTRIPLIRHQSSAITSHGWRNRRFHSLVRRQGVGSLGTGARGTLSRAEPEPTKAGCVRSGFLASGCRRLAIRGPRARPTVLRIESSSLRYVGYSSGADERLMQGHSIQRQWLTEVPAQFASPKPCSISLCGGIVTTCGCLPRLLR